jgi:CRP/FNR family transcriptional regulator, cyclic AMP receptor protein
VILHEGEAGDSLYLLLKGNVLIYSQSASGKVLTHGTITSGHYFGEMSLDGGKRSASVQAITDCECVLIPNAQVLAFAQKHVDFGTHLLQTVIDRARSSTEAAKNMALSDVYERLSKALHRAFEAGEGVCALTHQQMADQIGASREMVSKLIKDLERGGYVAALHRREIKRLKKIPPRW